MRARLTTALVAGLAVAGTSAASAQTAAAGVSTVYHSVHRYLVAAAEQVPEADYGYAPTKDVRTFGQLFGHVAGSNYMICATAAGEKNPNTTNFEKLTAKADIVAGLKASFDYCTKAFEMNDTKAIEPVDLFGMKTNRVGALAFNAGHDMEHYGNVVTYMRMKGMVPPSSGR